MIAELVVCLTVSASSCLTLEWESGSEKDCKREIRATALVLFESRAIERVERAVCRPGYFVRDIPAGDMSVGDMFVRETAPDGEPVGRGRA